MTRTKETAIAERLTSAPMKERREHLSPEETAFIEWARRSLAPLSTVKLGPPWEDLAPLGNMIGDAMMVALSEGVHCGAEPLEFRNRLLQYLVQEKNFTAIAIESGIVESRAVHDYVRGGCGDLSTVLAQGIGWTFDQLPQNETLIRWLREYNASPRHTRKVNFYGFDMPGSPANNQASRGIDTALTEALDYLSSVDRAAGTAFHARLDSLTDSMRFELRRSENGPGYEGLSQTERDALTAGIADLVTLLERREAKYTAASTDHDYAWAHRAAVGARQIDAWLRHIPIGWQPVSEAAELRSEQISFFPEATDVRDRAQVDNLDWIVRQEGPSGKILVFAARYHLSTVPVKSSFWCANGVEREQEVAGVYLRRRFGERLLTIGNLMGQAHTDVKQTLQKAPRQSIDGLAREIGAPLFVLDLRTAPASVADWLNQEHGLADGSQVLKLVVGKAFDVLFYIDAVTPASAATVATQRL